MNSENSLRGSIVALATPFLAVLASAIAGGVSDHIPGVQLDQTQIVAVMVAVVTAVLGIALKWLHGWQQHEQRVSNGVALAVKPATVPTASPTPTPATNGVPPAMTLPQPSPVAG